MIVIAMLFHCLQRAAEEVCRKFRQTVPTVLCCKTGFLSCRVFSQSLCKRDSYFVSPFRCPTFQVLSIKCKQGCSPFDNPNIPRDFSLFSTNKSLKKQTEIIVDCSSFLCPFWSFAWESRDGNAKFGAGKKHILILILI